MRSIAIIILCSLGLATHQLPILWTVYQTVHADYAIRHCVNKGTSCHGSCTMKRAFVRSNKSQQRSIPTAVANEIRDLSPYDVQRPTSFVHRPEKILLFEGVLRTFASTWMMPPPFAPPRA